MWNPMRPKMYGPRWLERAIGDLGQSSGTVVSGFLFINMSDPARVSGASETYGCEQLIFEPLLGGGLITALALPCINRVDTTLALVMAAAATLLSIYAGRRLRRRALPR